MLENFYEMLINQLNKKMIKNNKNCNRLANSLLQKNKNK